MMLRTALACLLAACAAWAAASGLTLGFEAWTAEGARRLQAQARVLSAPATPMAGPGSDGHTLAQLLANGRQATVVDFIYTRCTSVCSALGTAFQQMQAQLRAEAGAQGGEPAVRLLSISFDAAHDDARALRAHARLMRADPAIWRMAAAAQPADLPALLSRYGVVVIPDGQGGWEHNAALLVMDPAGRLVRIFDYDDLETALAFARSLARSQGA